MPKPCTACSVQKGKTKFSTAQWKKPSGVGLCIECAAQKKEAEQAEAHAEGGAEKATVPTFNGENAKQPAAVLEQPQPAVPTCSTCNVPSTHVYASPSWNSEPGALGGGGGGGGAHAHASGGGSAAPPKIHLLPAAHAVACEEELKFPCPICLDNEDDAYVDGVNSGMCTACGQMYCGACNTVEGMGRIHNCPTCRAPLRVSDAEKFRRLWKLVHDRSPGRHTPTAQNSLGCRYTHGEGVKQNYKEAVTWYRKAAVQGNASAQFNLGDTYRKGEGVKQDRKKAATWYRRAAEQGDAAAQNNLGLMYGSGKGVPQNLAVALTWLQLAAEQGNGGTLEALDFMQQLNLIPTPPPGTTVTTILLTSAKAAKYNNKSGVVVKATAGTAPLKPGRVVVLLDGDQRALAFNVKNLRA